ncbi:polysaccharide deacetylase family protein [Silvanigrella aquatica]|uniref:NodB homology domain-containing protein n=1 Tax=Silvanigrella aquatica TaxID=1915309 RepID=A0A1L4CX99_9BACT|nr:polysaccharide deacetylase family protein [Silvanigrella aquatica]APJ02575.1 hypothetical protein AXG55_00950 [Silvanigrella aquatica]
MIIQNILSIFVLSLCLATLFITLVTYFLYRVKQLLKFNQKNTNIVLESIFFKKYAPYIKIKEKEKDNEFDNKLSDRKTLTYFFGIISGIIFLSFLVGYLFSYFKLGEKTIDSAKYEELISGGLLKEYQLNTLIENPDLVEYISDKKIDDLNLVFKQLNNYKIGIFKSKGKNENLKNHSNAVNLWVEFFKRKKLNFKIITDLKKNNEIDLLLIPQLNSIKYVTRKEIEKLFNNEIGLFATGNIGYFDGLGVKSDKNLSEKIFGVEFKKNDDKKNNSPTVFEGNNVPWCDISPGMQLNIFPVDNNFIAISKTGISSSFESNTQSQIKKYSNSESMIIRSNFVEHPKMRAAWFALDPVTPDKVKANELFYLDLYIAHALQWVLKNPMAVVSTWKGEFNSVFVPSIEVDDDSDNAEKYKDLFKDYDFPVSLFISAERLQKKSALVEDEKNKIIEIASASENDAILQGNTLQNQFENIQNSRLLLEEFWHNKVYGFKPPQNRFDTTTMNAVIQNKMTYIIGNQTLFRFSPVLMNEGSFIYFPKYNLKELTMYKTSKFHNSTMIFNDFQKRFHEVEVLKGAGFFNFPSKSLTTKSLEKGIDQFFKYLKDKNVWKTNFIQLARWWIEKQNIYTTFYQNNEENKLFLEVNNSNPYDVTDIFVFIDTNREIIDGDKNNSIKIIKNNKNNVKMILIKKMLKNSKLNVYFR